MDYRNEGMGSYNATKAVAYDETIDRQPGQIEQMTKRTIGIAERIAMLNEVSAEAVSRVFGHMPDEGGANGRSQSAGALGEAHSMLSTVDDLLDTLERNVRRLAEL